MAEEVRYRILLAEDEKPMRDALKLNLELDGYEVVEAGDGNKALDVLRHQKIDLAILDVMMPGMDGFSVCQTARVEGNNTPVLFLTAKGATTDRIEGLKIGADDYMSKPFALEELMLRIQKLIVRRGTASSSLADVDEYTFGPNKVNFLMS